MGSSGGGSSNPAALYQNAAPMEGLPVAGKDSTIGSPYEYGEFQSFLPDIQPDGKNPMATGLTPDMLKFKSPQGVTAPSSDTLGIDSLRADLAKLMSNQNSNSPFGTKPQFGAAGGF